MEWKTRSVEAGDGFSKPVQRNVLKTLTEGQVWPDRFGLDSGMQKDGLTMFHPSCYSCWVPRVHPGLLCAVSFRRVVRALSVERLRNAFPVK
jgi:hypothetical protein